MNSKSLFRCFWWLLTLLATTPAAAQNAPGWAWVNYFGQINYNSGNNIGGIGRDAVGNLYVAGCYGGTPIIGNVSTTNAGETEAFISKYDPAGNLLWLKALHGPSGDAATKLVVEPSGRCTFSGTFGGGVGGGISFSEFGSTLVLPGPVQLGLPNGGNASNPSYGGLPFLATVEADGTLAWAICPSPTYDFDVQDMVRDAQGNSYLSVTTKGNVVVAGTTYPPLGVYDGLLLKYNSAGQAQWLRRGGAASIWVYGAGIKVDPTGGVYWLTQHTGPFAFNQATVGTGATSTLIRLSVSNQVRWIKSQLLQVTTTSSYFSNMAGLNVAGIDATSGALYLGTVRPGGSTISFSGATSSVAVAGPADSYTQFIVQCDTTGQVSWVKPVASALQVSTGPRGSFSVPQLFLVGNGFTLLTSTATYGQTTFAGSPATFSAAEGGLACVLHYNTTTNQTEWVRVGGTLPSVTYVGTKVKGAAIDPAGNVFLAGTFIGPANFGAISLPASGQQPYSFLAKLDQTVLATKSAAAGKPWQAYPNPATGTVRLTGLPAQAQVRVLDALGRQVAQWPAAAPDAPRSLAGLAPGLYLLQVGNTTETYQSQRLAVE